MKKLIWGALLGLAPALAFSQAGHIMQGVGAVNMSMGGAATAQPLDVSGALQWNPAGITTFSKRELSVNIGLFFSSPELRSSVPTPMGIRSGVTKDDRGTSPLPAVAFKFASKNKKHHFGISAFGISGFGVTFPESNTNPINAPQSMGGFGMIKSDYQLMQVGFSYARKFGKRISVGITPNFNVSYLSLNPNPVASPGLLSGYPRSDKASAIGYGAQLGILYEDPSGFKGGISYKTKQKFGEYNFTNTYLDGTPAPGAAFRMNYPAILSLGVGYSKKLVDVAVDYRFVDYENTEGFAEKGWTPTASVAGFGWKNISIVSAGIQYKGLKGLPLRVGYTFSSNPINPDLAFFSTPATAVIKHAVQAGFSYELTKKINFNVVYHYGTSGGNTSGPVLSPMLVTDTNIYGAVPSSEVSYKMKTSMLMFGANFSF